jgi:glyoxylate/hydroxypyruvate reductase A
MQTVLRNQQRKLWEPLEISWLYGETLGVAGVGQIGRAIASKAQAFDMRVIGFDLVSNGDVSVEKMYGPNQLAEFASEPRFISINMPLTQNTKGLFDRKVFDAMRPDCVLINTSRGGLVNEQDLIQALQKGSIGGAILDVFEEEPLPTASPLWEMPNVVVAPHHSGPSVPEEMVDFFLDNLDRWKSGSSLRGVVDRDRGF